MFRFFLPFLAIYSLSAQVTVEVYAGAGIRSGVPVAEAGTGTLGNPAWDPEGNLVFPDLFNDVVWRIRGDGIAEVIAGTGESGFSGDGGPATAARLYYPHIVAYDPAGNLYIADRSNFRIRRVDPQGIITTVAGDGIVPRAGMDRDGPALLRSVDPYFNTLVFSPQGELHFISGQQILRLTGSGLLEAVTASPDCSSCSTTNDAPAAATRLRNPTLIAFDGAGNLYVADDYGSHVRRISVDGKITAFAGYGASAGNSYPSHDGELATNAFFFAVEGLATDTAGNVYIAHRSAVPDVHRIQRVGSDGILHTVLEGSGGLLLHDPQGRIVFRDGNVFRAADGGAVVATLPDFTPSAAPGGTPAQDTLLLRPYAIAVNHQGEVYFAENDACRIRRIGHDGLLETVAGGSCDAAQPGPHGASSMAFDSQDQLWIRDRGYTFTVAPDGTVTTLPVRRDLGVEPDIALDAKDRLYVMGADYLNRLELDDTVLPIVRPPNYTGPPPPAADVNRPFAIGTDPDGNVVFAADPGGVVYRINDDGSVTELDRGVQFSVYHRLAIDRTGRIWNENGFVSGSAWFTVGTYGRFRIGDGLAQPALFRFSDSEFSPDGDLYGISDNRILKLSGLGPKPTPAIAAVVNAASFTNGPISAGEIVSIFGANFGTDTLQTSTPDNNTVPPVLGRTKVLFGPTPGRITAIAPNQINVIVPHYYLPSGSVDVVVQVDDAVSAPVSIPVADRAFALFPTLLNQDNSLNSATHPAQPGTVVQLFGTGEGELTPELPDGALVISTPYPTPGVAVTVRIGGQDAEVLYAGSAPYLPSGVFQINARVPVTLAPGSAAVEVSIGGSPGSGNTTVAVQ